jgi:hypothetical protein
LETFAAGPDGGIDLRHISVGGGRTIIQCKNLAASSFCKSDPSTHQHIMSPVDLRHAGIR